MKTNVAYEVVCIDKPDWMARTGRIEVLPGGILLILEDGTRHLYMLDDEDNQLFDREEDKQVELILPDIHLVLNQLGLAEWENIVPFWDENTPEFQTDDEVNEYVYSILRPL